MNFVSRLPTWLRAAPLLVGVICVAQACEHDAVVRPSASRAYTDAARYTLERITGDVGANADASGIVTGSMGAPLNGVARVRVTNAQGVATAGIVVRFSIVRGSATITRAVDTTDARGEVDGGTIDVTPADTALVHVQLKISIDANQGITPDLYVDVVSRRDLDHFGGTTAARFDLLPISRTQLSDVLPMGTMASADAALPSADAVLVPRGWRDGNRSDVVPVRAMSDGLVIAIDSNASAITMRVRDRLLVRYAGINLRSDLWVGRTVHTGEGLGVLDAGSSFAGLAVRVLDGSVDHQGWVRPERYGVLRNSAFFARYLADSVRSDAFALVRRAAPDLDGRIDYDRAGRLIGSWFDELAPQSAHDPDPSAALAPHAITFAYDAERPGQVRVAIGRQLASRLGITGVFGVAWEDADPAAIGVEQGMVTYRLFATSDDSRAGRAEGVLVAQLTDDSVYLGFVRDGDLPRLTAASLRLTR